MALSNPLGLTKLWLLACCWNVSMLLAQSPPARVPDHRSAASHLNDPVVKVFQQDATLRSIACVSSDRIVAVGDRGTILVSNDAGNSWRVAPTPVSANLSDVKFSGEIGYAVGGWIASETGCSYSTVLQTHDGGETWESLNNDLLPRLVGVHVSGGRLVCWGDYSVQLSACVFVSDDEGRTWRAAFNELAHASTAAVSPSGKIAVVDQLGRAKVQPHQALQSLAHANSSLNVLATTSDTWFAAGENGEFFTSTDGAQWSNVVLPLPPDLKKLCTWHCLEQRGSSIWLAGSPGSFLLRSQDSGQTWKVLFSGQHLPIHKMCFIDASRGWAVGPLGTILATRDGGANWYPQRKQPERLGLMAVSTDTYSVPWLAAVATVWDHKRSTAGLVLKHAEPIDRATARPSRETVVKEAAKQFALADLTVCDTTVDDEQTNIRRLAIQIATWRPDVVLTANSSQHPLLEGSAEWSTARAVQLASSPGFAEFVKAIDLTSWNVSKLSTTSSHGQCEYSEDSMRVLRDSGLPLRDIICLLPKADRESASQLNLVTTFCKSQSMAARSELLGGVANQPETQLTGTLKPLGSYQNVMGRVQRDRALQQFILSDVAGADIAQWTSQLRFFLSSVPTRELPQLYVSLVDGLLSGQKWKQAELVLTHLIQTEPGDSGLWAAQRYFQIASSSELQHWIALTSVIEKAEDRPVVSANYQTAWSNTPFATPNVIVNGVEMKANDATAGSVLTASASSVQPQGIVRTAPFQLNETEWRSQFEAALKLHPRLSHQPNVQMLLARQASRSRNNSAAKNLLSDLSERSQLIGWSQAAKQELGLLGNDDFRPKWSAIATPAARPPKLDGQLNEPFWNVSSKMRLSSLDDVTEMAPEISWAYDSEHLYLAIHCPQDDRQTRRPIERNRTYDSDLTGLDRVELMIDVDRDYNSTIDLAVAENGLTSDQCFGLAGFNPKWFVKIVQQPNSWQAEVAIKLSTIVDAAPTSGAKWAVSARRIRPSRTSQSWSQLKTHQRLPEAAGLLIFE